MDNKLSELSKPVAWVTMQPEFCDEERTVITNKIEADKYSLTCYDLTLLYSQEYVSALLAERDAFEAAALAMRDEWRARGERIAELENDLGTKHMRAVEEALVYATDRASELEASQSELAGALGSYIRFAELRRRELGGLSDEMEKVDAIARNAYIAAGFTVGDE